MFETLFSRGGLSLERLQTLCEIAKAQGISKAARGNTSKLSQYSKQIKELETHFGVMLFDRQKKSLTDAGKRILEACKPFLTTLEKLSADLSDAEQVISIGAGEAILQWVLFPRFADLATAFPRVVWFITGFDSRGIMTRLLDSDLDFGILRQETCQKENSLHCIPLGIMNIALFVPTALRRRSSIPVAALAGSEQFTPAFEKISETFTPQLVVKLRCQSFPAISCIVKTGQFAGMLPLLAESEMPRPHFETVKHPTFKALARNYVLAANRKNISMRDLTLVQHKLATLCRMQ